MNWLTRPWRHAFDYSGRSPRREYWLFTGQFLFGTFLIGALAGAIEGTIGASQGWADIVVILFILACMPVGLSAAVRRIHDHDKPGWCVLLYFVPFVGVFIFLFMMLATGTDGPNSYGSDPRDPHVDMNEVVGIFS
jgi:uncharacterized membrane protein YhaH (DUF805 family)